MSTSPQQETDTRDAWLGLRRGLAGRCPGCGRGPLFSSYLKVVAQCGTCGLAVGQYRADDGPAYFTIMIIGHVMVAPLLFVEAVRTWPVGLVLAIMLVLLVGATLWLLPIVKGAFVGVQWGVKDEPGTHDPALPDREP